MKIDIPNIVNFNNGCSGYEIERSKMKGNVESVSGNQLHLATWWIELGESIGHDLILPRGEWIDDLLSHGCVDDDQDDGIY